MKISAITGYRTNSVHTADYSNLSNHENYHSNSNSLPKTSQGHSHPSFGKFLIDDLFFGIKKFSTGRRGQQFANLIKEAELKIQNDTKIIAERLGIPFEEAQIRYESNLSNAVIEPDKKRGVQQIGLNKVVGYSLEKIELLKKVVSPIVENRPNSERAKFIILHGEPGTGKTHFIESLLEHIRFKINTPDTTQNKAFIRDCNLKENWRNGDTEENLMSIWNSFEEVKNNRPYIKHTFVQIDKFDDFLKSEKSPLTQFELQYQTQKSKDLPITWIGVTNNYELIPQWMKTDENKAMLEIGKIKSEVEVLSVFNRFTANAGRHNNTKPDAVIDALVQLGVNLKASNIKHFVSELDKYLSRTKDKSGYAKFFGREKFIGICKEPITDKDLENFVNHMKNKTRGGIQ